MTAPVQPQSSPSDTPPASSTPPGTTAGAPPADYRFGNDASVPAWARGKTAAEVLGVAQTLVESGLGERTPAPAASPQRDAFDGVQDDELLTGAQLRKIVANLPRDTRAVDLAASANVNIVRNDPRNAALIAKYGHEFDNYVSRLPAEQRTVDNLQQVVKFVRSDHIDELVSEQVNQRISSMEPTLRSNGAATPPSPVAREHTLESDKIPPEWKARAQAAKITPETVRAFCATNGMSEADFYKQFDKPLNAIVEDISLKRTY
jgi:hypothetical protein